MGTIKTTNIEPIADNGTITLGSSGDTFTVPSGVTVNMSSATQTGVGGVNTPAFSAYMSADQDSIASATWTKVNMNTEFFDSDGKYDVGNYRFTPTIAGKYMFGASLYYNSGNTMTTTEIGFYKNGTKILYASNDVDNDNKQQLTGVIDLDTDDYVELYAYASVASAGTFNVNQDGTTSNNRCYWYGYKILT